MKLKLIGFLPVVDGQVVPSTKIYKTKAAANRRQRIVKRIQALARNLVKLAHEGKTNVENTFAKVRHCFKLVDKIIAGLVTRVTDRLIYFI